MQDSVTDTPHMDDHYGGHTLYVVSFFFPSGSSQIETRLVAGSRKLLLIPLDLRQGEFQPEGPRPTRAYRSVAGPPPFAFPYRFIVVILDLF